MSIKRIVKDVTQLMREPLEDQGIYYKHDEDNIYMGYALIIGPKDTLYQHGFYLFKFVFSEDYPIKPPVVTFQTNNHNIRFHPNLYRNGKCCLSILNTWTGEQWSSCQSISTILLSLLLLFNNEPLLSEPGITKKHEDFETYNKVIQYYNYFTAFYEIGTNKITINTREIFKDIINKYYQDTRQIVLEHARVLNINTQNMYIKIYSIHTTIDYDKLLQKLN
tara:strand:+ start:2417 stop:3079 length:663 start_codon:yes stop_codon:yes gene_type:complete